MTTTRNSVRAGGQSLPAFVWANFKLQWTDFLIMPGAVAGCWALFIAILAVVSLATGDNELFGVGIAGVMAVVVACLMTLITSLSRIWLEFKIGVQMSVPRRRMIAAEYALCLATSAEGLVTAWLLDRVWMALAQLAAARYGAAVTDYYEPILSGMPLWGWLLACLLPAALGVLAGTIVLRFGSRGGWVLYALMMLVCCTSSIWIDWLDPLFDQVGGVGDLIMALLPPAAFALAGVCLLAATLLLRRVPVND